MDLFELGQQYFRNFVAEFTSYGLDIDPTLELRPTSGLLCYYDLKDGQIYLSVPGVSTPEEELQALMMSSLLGCKDTEELFYFYSQFIPWLIAHEMGHYLRHRYGLFSENLWHEEQVANQLAAALTKPQIPLEERKRVQGFIRRAIQNLGSMFGRKKEEAVDTYYNIAQALLVEGNIKSVDAFNIDLIRNLVSSPTATLMLKKSGAVTANVQKRLSRRSELISSLNDEYIGNVSRYMYYQIGWINLALESRETSYLSEFARKHLSMNQPLLTINIPDQVSDTHIKACFVAAQDLKPHSITHSRYFYKRYRVLLLNILQNFKGQSLLENTDLAGKNLDFLACWDDEGLDPLNYLTAYLPKYVRALFPNRIQSAGRSDVMLPDQLPTVSDQMVWQHAMDGNAGPDVSNTIEMLNRLDGISLFHNLPVEALIEIARRLLWVTYKVDDVVIWQNDFNEDVFILVEGQLEVSRTANERAQQTVLIEPGHVIGEISWLTKGPCTASVRALTPAKCLVIKGGDLQMMVYENPTILMQLAGAVAQRFADAYQQGG